MSCMTRFAVGGEAEVTPKQHRNDGCYSLEMATINITIRWH